MRPPYEDIHRMLQQHGAYKVVEVIAEEVARKRLGATEMEDRIILEHAAFKLDQIAHLLVLVEKPEVRYAFRQHTNPNIGRYE